MIMEQITPPNQEVDPAAPRQVTILADRLPEARKKLDKLVNKARRFGNPEVKYTVGEVFETTEQRRDPFTGRVRDVRGPDRVELTVSGPAPSVGPFEFLAKIDHGDAGNIVDIVPGRAVDPRFRSTPSLCEHCNTKRQRNETFVVHNRETGAEVQVGRSCLVDYIGTNTPAGLVSCFAFWAELRDFDSEWGGRNWDDTYRVEEVLAATAVAIRLFGWCSKGQAQFDMSVDPTSAIVASFLLPPRRDKHNGHIFERNDKLRAGVQQDDLLYAQLILNWLDDGGPGEGDYGHNLRVAAARSVIPGRRLGLVCSAVQAFERAQERLVRLTKEREAKKVSQFVGQLGERLRKIPVTFLSNKYVSSNDFGDLIAQKYQDEAGNLLTWMTGSGSGLNPGEKCLLTGTVKAHATWNEIRETKLSRCVVEDIA